MKRCAARSLYDFSDAEIYASLKHAKDACTRLNAMTINDDGYRAAIEDLIPGIPADSVICPPFHCDHGHGIRIGRNVFVNYNVTMLDGGMITIGDNCLIGPNCPGCTRRNTPWTTCCAARAWRRLIPSR